MVDTEEGPMPQASGDAGESVKTGVRSGKGVETHSVEVLDLQTVVDLTGEEIRKVSSGKAYNAFSADFKPEVVRSRDEIMPEIARGYRACGSSSKAMTSNTAAMVNVVADGRLREGNTGNGMVSVFNHTWYLPKHTNTSSGSYRTKASLALQAEATAFDTAFYRMQRRDQENVQGYLVAHLDKGGNPYGSFLQEALSHTVYQKVAARNLLDRAYGEGLTNEYELHVPGQGEEAGDEEGWDDEGRGGILVARDRNPVQVTAHPDFGILWPDPADVGPPGDDGAEVLIIPVEEIMGEVVTEGVQENDQGIFVSRAKDPESLASDILALFAGTRQEFGIYPMEVKLILATMRGADLNSILVSWGLRPNRKGDLRDLAHWLRFKMRFTAVDSQFVSTKADYLRCRDYMALSNTLIGVGASWVRVHAIQGERNVALPYASWQARLSVVYNVLEFTGEQWTAIRSWNRMRTLAIMRGIDLGAMIDYASQTTVGSVRNLRLFDNLRAVVSPFLLALALVTNLAYSISRQQLCFRYDWLDGGVEVDVGEENSEEVLVGLVGTDDPEADEGDAEGTVPRWWIETRMTWEALQSPDLDFPIRTDYQEDRRAGVVRYGSNVIYSHQSERLQNDRFVSLLQHGDEVVYQYTGVEGRVNRILTWTNSRLPVHYVHWCDAIDRFLKGCWAWENLIRVERRVGNVLVAYDSDTRVGDFAGIGEFSGFEDF
jgi:hypothetical protein